MIIFGTRGVTYNHRNGKFHCPACLDARSYRYKRVRRFFTLYFIPCIPLDLLGEYVECAGCKGTYDPKVLDYDPGAENKAFEKEFERAVRRTMILMMLADGVIEAGEIRTIQEVFGRMSGRQLSEEEIRAEAEQARGSTVESYLGSVAGKLNDAGKEMVVRSAWFVAAADGQIAAEEMALVQGIGKTLELTPAHLKGVLAELAGSV